MKWRGWPAVGVALLVAGVCEASSAPGSLLMVPVQFASADGETAAGENGLFVVPENRRAADSRPIAIRFIRFPAAVVREGRARAPVMLLPGGPGSEDPGSRRSVEVVAGAEDLRQYLVDADSLLGHGVARRGLANWPRFILEMRAGDYRYLAALALEHRRAPGSDSLVYPLIDNSLGITAARDAKLRAEPEARWLGDINAFYHNTRDLTPTPVVSDDFRLNEATDVPVVLLNGDFDWSTPIENAQALRRALKHGHLLQVHGGTHCMEDEDMRESVGGPLEKMYEFLDADFEKTPVDEVLRALPESASYPPIQFAVPGSQSMYDEWVKERVAHAS